MRIPRIYLNQELVLNTVLTLPKDAALHLSTVLKRKDGNNIILFNNKPDQNNKYGEYTAEIIESHKNNIIVKILEYKSKNTKSKINIELAQCISKPNHFEITLQKSVELGVNIITPIISERSEHHHSYNKFSRWQKIIINACEQSGRTDLPVLNQPTDINDWVHLQNKQNINNKTLLLGLCTKTNNSLYALNHDYQQINNFNLLIGPEGGLADSETTLLSKNNFHLVKLGDRILRTETAGLVIISILQFISHNL
jgi:16S rRNA (uracil1498-N3)-methyltransferase